MKKIFLTFCAMFFASVSGGFCAYFYADALEQVIQETIPADLQMSVANEFEAQMNPETGEIDEQGMYNVCYVAGFDVNTASGAAECGAFVNAVSNKCVYASGNTVHLFDNPVEKEDKVQKCLFLRAMKLAMEYEQGFQQTPGDKGSCICRFNGTDFDPLDENGNVVRVKDCAHGGTNFGVTTCFTGLSTQCVKNMTQLDAYRWYWTHMFYGMGYNKLPWALRAGVMQLAVAGTGVVAGELKSVVGAQKCGGSKITDCILNAVNKYMETHTAQEFYNTICEKRKNRYNVSWTKYRTRAERTKGLVTAYSDCLKLYE